MSKIVRALNAQKLILSESKTKKKCLFSEARTPFDKGLFYAKDDGMSGCPTLWSSNNDVAACIVYSPYDKEYQIIWNIPEDGAEPEFTNVNTGEEAFKLAKSKGMKFKPEGIEAFVSYLKDELKVTK